MYLYLPVLKLQTYTNSYCAKYNNNLKTKGCYRKAYVQKIGYYIKYILFSVTCIKDVVKDLKKKKE